MRLWVLAVLVLCCQQLPAQYQVTFVIKSYPPSTASDSVYIAGNFNNWNPQSQNFKLQHHTITIAVPKGIMQYKFTRGSWDKVEVAKGGTSIDNRILQVEKDTLITVAIDQWSDHFPAMQKRSTVSKNVRVMDTAFYMPQLHRHRRIWIYVPQSYAASNKHYPVLYLQDGQNIFDEATSFSGEWGVDEALDTLNAEGKECIVVAIDNGGEKRINEYAPYDMKEFGKGEGDQYVDFIVKTLKPYIENNYRVKTSPQDCFIAGSSMGGLISFYAMLKYPHTFGAAGVFSPAFWLAPQLKEQLAQMANQVWGKIYFYAGEQESEAMVPDMVAVYNAMKQHSKAHITIVVNPEGQHAEAAWQQEFPRFYKWLLQ
jgi:predicted alpha/beta superfamily hydrolase